MPGALAPVPGGGPAAGSTRIIPPLPADISILPVKAAAPKAVRRRLRRRHVVLLVIVALVAFVWFRIWCSNYDHKRIDTAVKLAVLMHAPKGARFPVRLWSGPRILELEFTTGAYPKGYGVFPGFGTATTCAFVSVLDPKRGTIDPKYKFGNRTCIPGLAYSIKR